MYAKLMQVKSFVSQYRQFALLALLMTLLVAVGASPSALVFAQTPVPLEIPVNDIFTSANSWITTFAPIMAIGIGIAIALAILTFLGDKIVAAFRGGRK